MNLFQDSKKKKKEKENLSETNVSHFGLAHTWIIIAQESAIRRTNANNNNSYKKARQTISSRVIYTISYLYNEIRLLNMIDRLLTDI